MSGKVDWLTVAENLRKAARYIEQYGWVRGKIQGINGSVCAAGALWLGVGVGIHQTQYTKFQVQRTEFTPEGALLISVFREQGPVTTSITHYNDHVARDADDVIRCFEKAAVRAEEKAGLD